MEGKRIRMIKNCKDNHNIKKGWTGKVIDDSHYSGALYVEFDVGCPVSGNGISCDDRNYDKWYISKNDIEFI